MKVFVFCVAFLLATAVKTSPIDDHYLVSSHEVKIEEDIPSVDIDDLSLVSSHEVKVDEAESPSFEVNVEEAEVSSNELNVEDPSSDVDAEVQVDPLAEAKVDPVPESFIAVEEVEKEEEDESLAEESIQEDQVENENSEINEDSEPEAVPYENEDEAKALQIDEEPKMTEEDMEKTFGIAIDVCNTYNNPRFPMHLSHLKECGKFYKCYEGRGYLMDCPAGEHWSVNLDRCDYPSIAKCKIDGTHHFKIRKPKPMPIQASEQVEEEEEKPEPEEIKTDPRCEGSDPFKPMHYNHVSDCTKFYKCYMGKAYVIKCPKGQQWAQKLNRCEHPQIAKCTIAPTVVKPTVVKPAGIKPAQAMEEDSSESAEYYEYDYYDYGPKITDDPDFIIDDVRCIPDDIDRFHPLQFAHATDCTMFYKCFDHQAYKVQCPGGLHYSESEQMCDYPEEANCKVGIAQAQAQETPYSPSIPVCPKDDDVKFPIEGSFTQYFQCMGGLSYLMECQAEQVFNPMTSNCEKPQMPMPMMPQFPNSPEGMPQFPNSPEGMQQMPNWMNQFPGGMPQFPGMMPNFPNGMPNSPEGVQQMPDWMNQFQGGMMPQFPGMMPQYPGGMPQFPMMPNFPNGMPNSPEGMQQMPEWMNQIPGGMMPQFPGMMPQFPGGMMPQFPGGMMPQYPGMMPNFPNGMPQFPEGMMPQYPFPMMPQMPNNQPESPVKPETPSQKPQSPLTRPNPPQQPQKPEALPEFPSWMPVPNPNVQLPQLPNAEKPSHEKPTDKNEFNYTNGKQNSRCPSSDNPTKPQHLQHESDCQKFYKCFNGRAFLMECPAAQEWSDELQRCDYHQFAKCDATELIKKKIQV